MKDPRIQKLMAARRAELRKVHRNYPKFKPGMTTAQYIEIFGIGCRLTLLDYDLTRFNRPAPMLNGPELLETIDESEN